MKRERKIKLGSFLAITLVLILVTAFSVTGTVMSQGNQDLEIKEEYYQIMEEQYVDKVRQYLVAQGLKNSGIMLTRVVGEDGSRVYTLTVNHQKLQKLSEEEHLKLEEDLKEMEFQTIDCSFRREFQSV